MSELIHDHAWIHGALTASRPQAVSALLRYFRDMDTAEEDLPFDFNQFLSKDERLDMAKLALAIVKHPGKIPSLLRLRQQSDTAARRLSEVLGRVLLT